MERSKPLGIFDNLELKNNQFKIIRSKNQPEIQPQKYNSISTSTLTWKVLSTKTSMIEVLNLFVENFTFRTLIRTFETVTL